MSLQGRIAIVTGGSRGIGRATALALAKKGAKVVVNYLKNRKQAQQIVTEIQTLGSQALAVQADVRKPEEVANLVAKTKETFNNRIDILVSNANMHFAMKPFAEMTWEEFSQKLNDELKAAFVTTQAVIPTMTAQKCGRIIYTSSGAGKHPTPSFIAHGTAKGGLDAFARYIAHEFGPHGITANVVSPGMTQTDAIGQLANKERIKQAIESNTPLGRIARPEDIAEVIAFFASEESGFVTGSYTPVNGGMFMI